MEELRAPTAAKLKLENEEQFPAPRKRGTSMLEGLQTFDLDNAARNLLIVIGIVAAFVAAAWFLQVVAPVASTPLPSEEMHETLARIENGEEA